MERTYTSQFNQMPMIIRFSGPAFLKNQIKFCKSGNASICKEEKKVTAFCDTGFVVSV